MSFENKGSLNTTVTVSREPDRSGNFVSDGTDTALQNAVTYIAALGGDATLTVKRGTYVLTSLSVNTPLRIVGEGGVVFDLNAKPCLTITVAATLAIFDGIRIISDLDGTGHLVIQNAETRFENCEFDFQLDTEAEDAVIRNEPASANKVEFRHCVVTQVGKTDVNFFEFFKTGENMTYIKFNDFRIVEAITDNAVNGSCKFITADTDKRIEYVELNDILWEHLNCKGAAFLYSGAASFGDLHVDGFTFLGGTWVTVTSLLTPFTGYDGDGVLSNLQFFDKAHAYGSRGQYSTTKVTNMYIEGSADHAGGFDNQAVNDTYPRFADFENCTFYRAGLDFNSGIAMATVSNCTFRRSRLTLLDEETGGPMAIEVTDSKWYMTGSGGFDYCILVAWDQGVDISHFIVSNVIARNMVVFINCSGQPSAEQDTLWVFDHVFTYPRISAALPHFINDTGRTDDDQRVWIFDSYITTVDPPVGDWGPVRVGDRFDNVTWLSVVDDTEYFSEFGGKATILNGQPNVTVTHNLIISPDTWGYVQVTGAENNAEAHNVVVHTVGATTFIIEHLGGNVTADRDVYWDAHIKP